MKAYFEFLVDKINPLLKKVVKVCVFCFYIFHQKEALKKIVKKWL